MSELLSRHFTHVLIPSEIWLRRDLSMQAKALWAELRSLHCPKAGGCYASEEYLCEFMQLKRRRFYELLAELRDLNLLEVVSFDGRRTVRKAIVPEIEYVSAHEVCGKVHSSSAEKCTPHVQDPALPSIYREESKEERIYTIPTHDSNESKLCTKKTASPISAIADEVGVSNSSSKKMKQQEFSPLVHEITQKMLAILAEHNPVYRPPTDMNKFMYQVKQMVEVEKQNTIVLLKTFTWAVSDNEQRGDFKGWQSVIVTNKKGGKATNPAQNFREAFSKIHSQMNSKPKRKFAPSSNDNVAHERLKSMRENAI